MSLKATVTKKTFKFSFKARTSRGVMQDKESWFITLWDTASPGIHGVGECGPLPGLSIDHADVKSQIDTFLPWITSIESLDDIYRVIPPELPSVRFALETAFLDLQSGGRRLIFDNGFVHGKKIPINGLIWMGDLDFMMSQINEKISQGFRCIKLKVGGLNFDRECDILGYIRKRYFREDIEIRLDANGAFSLDDALFKLSELAKFNIQSIEQPIRSGQPEMEELCRKSAIPVALDEELIGIHNRQDKQSLIRKLKPSFIILKPSLLGGLASCEEWISLAEEQGTGWWMTSALESNIGLNAIAQFTCNYNVTIPQGLGTGGIYTNNVVSPLQVSNGELFSTSSGRWDVAF